MRRNQMGNNNSTNTTNVSALRRRMVAAQRALTRATKTLAALPRIKQQRQRILQQPQKLVKQYSLTITSFYRIVSLSREISLHVIGLLVAVFANGS